MPTWAGEAIHGLMVPTPTSPTALLPQHHSVLTPLRMAQVFDVPTDAAEELGFEL